MKTRVGREADTRLLKTSVDNAIRTKTEPAELPPMAQPSIVVNDLEELIALIRKGGGATARTVAVEHLDEKTGVWQKTKNGRLAEDSITVTGGELVYSNGRGLRLDGATVDDADGVLVVLTGSGTRKRITVEPFAIPRSAPLGDLTARGMEDVQCRRQDLVERVAALIEAARQPASRISEVLENLQQARDDVLASVRALDGTQATRRGLSDSQWAAVRDQVDQPSLELLNRATRVHHGAIDKLYRAASERLRYAKRASYPVPGLSDQVDELRQIRRGLAVELDLLAQRSTRPIRDPNRPV